MPDANDQRAHALSRDASPAEVLRRAGEMLASGADVCIATVVGSEGSVPSTPGQKLLVGSEGTVLGTVGGGAVEREATERMQRMVEQGGGEPTLAWFALAKDLAMACGGRVQLLFEPMVSATPLLIVGAGHIGAALAALLPRLGFRVVITDERESAVEPSRFAGLPAERVRLGKASRVAADLPTRAAVVVATHDHALDQEALIWAVERGQAYVGGVGSKTKAAKLRKALVERGVPDDRIAAVRMPIGLAIGARTPEEIGISIAGELIAWRAGKQVSAAPTPPQPSS